ncbi:hypothetical protein ABK040_010673 [Willaertia magna]
MGAVVSTLAFQPPTPATYDKECPYPVTFIPSIKSNKQIAIYHLKAKSEDVQTTILYSHGNGMDIGQSYDFLTILRDRLNVNVVHYEYFGYGILKDVDSPSEEGVYECACSTIDYLINKLNIPQDKIILYGTSMGTAASIYLAAHYRGVGGVILEAPFQSIVRTVSDFFMGRLVDIFPSYMRIGAIEAPVFVIHGENDTVVPVEHGIYIQKHVRNSYPGLWVKDAGHNNLREILGLRELMNHLKTFMEHCGVIENK